MEGKALRCPNPGCNSSLRLVVSTQGITNLECEECSYGMFEDIQNRALPLSSLLYPKADFCATLLWVFNMWRCQRWSDVLINVGIVKRLYATGMRQYIPDHDELTSQLLEHLNLVEYRLGDALQLSLQSPSMIRASWMQYIDILDAMSPEDFSIQDVLFLARDGTRYNFLEQVHRFEPTTQRKETFDEHRVIDLVESMIPPDQTVSKLDSASVFTEINRRFEMLPHVAVEVYSKLTNILAALKYGPGSSIAKLWNDVSSSH